jgi:hypothetical protein
MASTTEDAEYTERRHGLYDGVRALVISSEMKNAETPSGFISGFAPGAVVSFSTENEAVERERAAARRGHYE